MRPLGSVIGQRTKRSCGYAGCQFSKALIEPLLLPDYVFIWAREPGVAGHAGLQGTPVLRATRARALGWLTREW